jgi:hypothetical protein
VGVTPNRDEQQGGEMRVKLVGSGKLDVPIRESHESGANLAPHIHAVTFLDHSPQRWV